MRETVKRKTGGTSKIERVNSTLGSACLLRVRPSSGGGSWLFRPTGGALFSCRSPRPVGGPSKASVAGTALL